MKLEILFKNKEIRNAGWIIGERILQMILSLLVGILTARYLGPTDFGELNYTASYVTFFTSVASLGMEGVIIKRMISFPKEEGDYLGGCLVLRLVSSIISSFAIIILICILNPGDSTKIILAALQSLQLIFQAVNILDSWFQRHLKSKYISIGKSIGYLMVSVYKVILIFSFKRIEWFAFANSLMTLIIAIVLFGFYIKNNGPKIKFSLSKGMDVLQDSYHYILSGIMVALYNQMDKVMIGKMLSDTDVGLYTTATIICGMWIFIPTAIIQSFRPTIMEIREIGDTTLYMKRLQQLYSFIIWLCIVVSLIICLLAPFIIRTLYGNAYMGAAGTLRIAIWFETFSMIGTARGIWILCENKNKFVKYYLSIGVAVNFILNLLLIPRIGIEGAALATLCTQIITSIVAPLFFKETRIHTKIVWDAFILKWHWNKKISYD